MNAKDLIEIIGSDFYTGVPDSQLKALCDYLYSVYGTDPNHHIIAANEGNCVGLAAGYNLATGKVPVVYMQNSGEGNAINPIASLLNEDVYAIPCVFIIGWRGEPGIKDEPQHVFQGKITLKLLEILNIEYFVISKETGVAEVKKAMEHFNDVLAAGKQVAFVVRKGALTTDAKPDYNNCNSLLREEIIKHIVKITGNDPIVSTTGKASRELFEVRESLGHDHSHDFLTVGSMGHSSSIALEIALQHPAKHVWCIDGDGAVLMHMGALVEIGAIAPKNLTHIVINNGAHETVGGMPTALSKFNISKIAESCGYSFATTADSFERLDAELKKAAKSDGPYMIEVKSSIGARSDLGRPTTTPIENKRKFMESIM